MTVINKLPDSPTKELIMLSSQAIPNQALVNKVIQYLPDEILPPFRRQLRIEQFKAKFQKQLIDQQFNLETFTENLKLLEQDAVSATTLVGVCYHLKQYGLATEMIKKIDQSVIQQDPALQFLQVFLQNDEDLLAIIKQYHADREAHAELYYIAAISCLDHANTIAASKLTKEAAMELAIKYIAEGGALSPNKQQRYHHVISNALVVNAEKHRLETTSQVMLDINFTPSPLNTDLVWAVNGKKLLPTSDEVYDLGNLFDGKQYYGYVDPESRLIDRITLTRSINALSKGKAKGGVAHNGVKFVKPSGGELSGYELKINEDIRLFASILHQNLQGELLVVFDRVAKHARMRQVFSTNKSVTYVRSG